MKLLILGSFLLVALAACAAPDPTVTPAATPMQAASQAITGADVASDRTYRTQEDIDLLNREIVEIIDLSPTATASSIHADVGDLVAVQVNISGGYSRCTDLKVRDPFGNVAIELASKEIRSGDGDFVQFRGAFFAPAAGDYLVDLGRDSENISCRGIANPHRAEVKWTVQPNLIVGADKLIRS